MGRSLFQKKCRVLIVHTAANLQSLRVCAESQACLPHILLIIWTVCRIQKDNVPAGQTGVPVQNGIIIAVLLRNKIILRVISLIQLVLARKLGSVPLMTASISSCV